MFIKCALDIGCTYVPKTLGIEVNMYYTKYSHDIFTSHFRIVRTCIGNLYNSRKDSSHKEANGISTQWRIQGEGGQGPP